MAEKILLKNITAGDRLCDILIADGKISRIAEASTLAADGADVEDCTGKVAVPGFINMHTHSGMSLMRGIQEDTDFHKWIDSIWKIESKLDDEFIYWATKVSCLEMIKTGTTTFNDQYWFIPTAWKAVSEMGLRGIISYVVLDSSSPSEAGRQQEECARLFEESRSWGGKNSFAVTIHAVYTVTEGMIRWSADFARKNNLLIHIHVSETRKEVEDCKAAHGGLTPVQYLDSLGVLGPDVIAAHTLWLTPEDIAILAKRGVHCVHNINSNTKLASGYRFLYNELKDAGVNVCIGTDGCASSNNLDMLEAMKTSALFQKAWRDDPTAMPVGELMDMATVNGARALRLNAGVIKEGAAADISIVDTDNSFFLSPAPFLSNLIHSAHSDCIDSVIADGKFVMRHRIVAGEKEILGEARKVMSKII